MRFLRVVPKPVHVAAVCSLAILVAVFAVVECSMGANKSLAEMALPDATLKVANATDLSQWHEVQGGTWIVDRSLWSLMQSRLQTAATEWAGRQNLESHQASGVRFTSSSNEPLELLPVQRRDLLTYVIQLQGQLQDGRRVVRIAGACATQLGKPERMDKRFMMVFDGGDCFFDAFFDPETQQLIDFKFHGVA